MRNREIELLNSEGPILTCKSTKDGFVIYDRDQSIVEILNKEEFEKFISGEIILYNFEGKEINYPSFSKDMKPTNERLKNFIESDNKK